MHKIIVKTRGRFFFPGRHVINVRHNPRIGVEYGVLFVQGDGRQLAAFPVRRVVSVRVYSK